MWANATCGCGTDKTFRMSTLVQYFSLESIGKRLNPDLTFSREPVSQCGTDRRPRNMVRHLTGAGILQERRHQSQNVCTIDG